MHARGFVRFTAALQATLLLASLFLPALTAAAELTTDLWVYQDGDTVTVTGVEYGANEAVSFVTTDPDGAVVDSGSASTDELGNVTYGFTLHVTVGGIYTTVGTGATSGLAASVQFDPVSISNVVDVSSPEGSGSHVQNVTVRLGGTGSAINVFWRTVPASGNATAGASCGAGVEYVATSGSTSSSVDFTVPVTICGDSAGELDETFTFQASTSSTFSTSPPSPTKSGTVTILNDDTGISIADVTQNEGNAGTSTFSFAVNLTTAVPTGGQVSLTWLTSDGTANDGNCVAHKDYNSSSGTLNFAAGESSKSINVTVCGDTAVEANETFTVDLSVAAATNYTVALTDGHAVGTIVNDDVPPSNTAPSVTVGGVADGASYNKGSVPAATCDVVDAEDGNSSSPATLSAITGPYASDGIGSQTASCSYTDGGGLTATASATYSIVDPSAPSISVVVTPTVPDGNAGWYRSNVTVTWTVTDADSPGSLVKTGCVDQSITSDQAATTYSCSATSAGGSAGPVSVTIKRDATAPGISYDGQTPPANGAGWNNTDVTLDWTCSDTLSGPASLSDSHTLTGEGAGQSSTGDCYDNAGNHSSDTQSGIKIDKTAPGISYDGQTPPANGAGWNNTDVTLDWTCSDTLSGPASLSDSHTLTGEGAGQSSTGDCYDIAGNHSSDTQSGIKIDKTAPGISYDGQTPPANGAGWNNTDVTLDWTCSDTLSGPASLSDSHTLTGEGAGQSSTGDCYDIAGNHSSDTQSGIKIDKTAPTLTCQSANFILNQPSALVYASVADGLSGAAATPVSAAANTAFPGAHSVSLDGYDNAGNHAAQSCSYFVGYNFTGLSAPVDRPSTLNVSKAGQAIPLKWRLTDWFGVGVTNITSVTVRATGVTCDLAGTSDQVEEYAAGASGLQNQGNGYYQFNWKTPTNYVNSCKTIGIEMGAGSGVWYNDLAYFRFVK